MIHLAADNTQDKLRILLEKRKDMKENQPREYFEFMEKMNKKTVIVPDVDIVNSSPQIHQLLQEIGSNGCAELFKMI